MRSGLADKRDLCAGKGETIRVTAFSGQGDRGRMCCIRLRCWAAGQESRDRRCKADPFVGCELLNTGNACE